MEQIVKNRNRSQPSFANINLLGKCNFDCRWCLGKDLPEFYQYNNLNTLFLKWPKFGEYLEKVKAAGVKQIYITGQNTDSLCYKYLASLIGYLKGAGFYVGLRTNGRLAERKMDVINEATTCLGDAISLTVLTLDPYKHGIITGSKNIPNWDKIIPAIKVPLRVAIVIDRYNVGEFLALVTYLSKFSNIRYIQVRKIATDTRYEEFKEDMMWYESLYYDISKTFSAVKKYESAESYLIYGMECSFWRTVATTANSLNYYTNGVISDEYFIIEGYLKNKKQLEK